MRYCILGPLAVEHAGRDLTPPRPKQRALLAAMVISANEVVPNDELIDAAWGATPPPSSHTALHGHISSLRKLLGRSAIETRPPGYLLSVEPADVDARSFELQLAVARAERDPGHRVTMLRQALGLFRGDPLVDFRFAPFARDESLRLATLRRDALTECLEAEIKLGRPSAVIPELDGLVSANPIDERLHGALMLALYASGRQAQALQVYADLRHRLINELGVEPGTALQQLQLKILREEPAFDAAAAPLPGPSLELPPQHTTLVGRRRELDALRILLGPRGPRLLTLTGPGGIGKTRLALEAAAAAGGDHGDGPVLVPLAGVRDPSLVVTAVAQVLSVRASGGRTVEEALAEQLADRAALLVLDNCEHVLSGAAAVVRTLAGAGRIRVLATSREPLRAAGEQVYPLSPLSDAEAVRLFVDRAQAVRPDFTLSAENTAAVSDICRRVDGLPLAIELAAARVTVLPPAALLARLEERLTLLAGHPDQRPERHQTLRMAIDWSYQLLSEEDRVLFARLSVFAGGWTLNAAERVCGNDVDVLVGLGSLIDKSLARLQGGEGDGRFAMLETIREYAREQLDQCDAAEMQDRHLAWCVDVAERTRGTLRAEQQPSSLARLHDDLDNFRAALGWSLTRAQPELALRLCSALLEFWMVRADWSEGRIWLERALDMPGPVEASVRMRALRALGELADALSDYPAATRSFQASLEVARSLDDRRGVAEALYGLAFEADRVGQHREARTLLEESITLFRELGDEPSLARSLGGLAWLEIDYRRARALRRDTLRIHRRLANPEHVGWSLIQVGFCEQKLGNYGAARDAYTESLATGRELRYERMVARALTQLAEVALIEGDPGRARPLLEESLPIWRSIGHRSGLVDALRAHGDLARLQGDHLTATDLLEDSRDISREIGARPRETRALQSLGVLAADQGDDARSATLLREALLSWVEMGELAEAAEALRLLAEVAASGADVQLATQLFGAAERLREQTGTVVGPGAQARYDAAVAAAHAALGDGRFRSAWEAGGDADIAVLLSAREQVRLFDRPGARTEHAQPT